MPPDDDDDDFQTLTNLLSTDKGKSWLTETLKGLGLELKAPAKPGDPPEKLLSADPFAGFLERNLREERAANSSLREKLENLLEILTPEQRTLLRSARSAGPADPPGRKSSAPPQEPARKKFLAGLKSL